MPISPAPPSGAKTSSSVGDVISNNGSKLPLVGWVEPPGPASGRPDDKLREIHHGTRRLHIRDGFRSAQPILRGLTKRKHVASCDRLSFATRGAQHQPACIVDRFETPDCLALGKSHPDRLPKPQCAGKPSRPDIGKTCAAVPSRESYLRCRCQMIEQHGSAYVGALGGKVRRR